MRGWVGAVLGSALCACMSAPPPAPVDQGVDGAVTPPDGAPVDCDELFGTLPDYFACIAEEPGCAFFAACEPYCTCTEMCEMRGATCLSSFNTSGGSPTCTPSSADEDCQASHGGQICVCMP